MGGGDLRDGNFLGDLNHFSDEGDCFLELRNVLKGKRIREEGLYGILERVPVGITKVKTGEGGCRWGLMRKVTVNQDRHMITPYVLSYGEVVEKWEELCIAQCKVNSVRIALSCAVMCGAVII
jgi:hypothetical protein